MLQDSVFTTVKTTGLSTSVFSHLQPTEEFAGIGIFLYCLL